MTLQRTRRYALVVMGIGLIPLLLWIGLLLIAPDRLGAVPGDCRAGIAERSLSAAGFARSPPCW